MTLIDSMTTGGTLGESDPLRMESPTVDPAFDPGEIDRQPNVEGADTSMPDTRLALRNEIRSKVFFANRDRTLIDDPNILL